MSIFVRTEEVIDDIEMKIYREGEQNTRTLTVIYTKLKPKNVNN